MMKKFNRTSLSVAVLAALAAPLSAHAIGTIGFDQTGTGAGGTVISSFNWSSGNALLNDVIAAGGGSNAIADFFGQTTLGGYDKVVGQDFQQGTRIFTYQFDVPVASTVVSVAGGSGNTDILTNRGLAGTAPAPGSFFNIYVDTAINTGAGDTKPDITTGLGFGDTGVGTNGLKLILHGTVALKGALAIVQSDTNANAAELSDTVGTNIITVRQGGSTTLLIDVLSVDTKYFTTDISSLTLNLNIGASTADLTTGTLGTQAPFNPGVASSPCIVGNCGPGDDPTKSRFFGEDQTRTVSDPPTNPISLTGPLSDQDECPAGAVSCDMQLMTSGNSQFNHTALPEPGSLALLGLGLGVAGMLSRRRKVVS